MTARRAAKQHDNTHVAWWRVRAIVIAQSLRTHSRPDAVGTNEHTRTRASAVGKADADTVGILLVGMLLGAVAHLLATREDCPMYAILQDVDGDHSISRQEWQNFVCAGCKPGAFCLSETKEGLGFKRTCGDGSSSPAGCAWDFDSLSTAFRT